MKFLIFLYLLVFSPKMLRNTSNMAFKSKQAKQSISMGKFQNFRKGLGGEFFKKNFFVFFMKFLIFLYSSVFFSQKCLEIPQKWPSNQSKPNNQFHEILSLNSLII